MILFAVHLTSLLLDWYHSTLFLNKSRSTRPKPDVASATSCEHDSDMIDTSMTSCKLTVHRQLKLLGICVN